VKQTVKELRYAIYLTRHPFKAYWDIKHENEGSLKTAMIILGLTMFTQVLSKLFTGFLFGGVRDESYNCFSTIGSFLAIYLAWCISNWCLTCLSDGKGTFKDICIATAYAFVPYIIIQLIMIALSNQFIAREAVFYNILNNLSLVWVAFLLVVGMLVTHQFTLTRTVVVILFTIVGMIAMGCLLLLFFNLIQQVVGFVSIVIDELLLRMSQ